MIRKAILVVLTVGAVGTTAIEMWSVAGLCPARVHLGRSDRGSERLVYSASHSWYSTVGYLRWPILDSNGEPWGGEAWDEEIGMLYLR